MKPLLLLLAVALTAQAETAQTINKRFPVQPGGKLVVDVDFGSIDVNTNDTREIVVDVVRKVTRASRAEEEAYLADQPITFSEDGNTLTLSAKATRKARSWTGVHRNEAKYVITVPAQFSARLKTSGGAVAVTDLTGDVNASTSGGGLKFTRLHGPLEGRTSGGSIRVVDCEGRQDVSTSGGGIDVSGGVGSFAGKTSGGSVNVKDFRGALQVRSSGGGMSFENVAGKLDAKTSGGAISAHLASVPSESITLATSGGGVKLRVPENSSFDLDASTSGGSVSSDLPVSTTAKPSRSHLKGPVNGGGKPVTLSTSGGSIRVQKS